MPAETAQPTTAAMPQANFQSCSPEIIVSLITSEPRGLKFPERDSGSIFDLFLSDRAIKLEAELRGIQIAHCRVFLEPLDRLSHAALKRMDRLPTKRGPDPLVIRHP